jgi:hypothetical protein
MRLRSRNVTIGVLGITLLLVLGAAAMMVTAYEEETIPCYICHNVTDVLTLTSNATGTVDVFLGEEFTLIVDAEGYTRGDRNFVIAIYKSWSDNSEFNFTEGYVSDDSADDLNPQMRAIRASITFTALTLGDHTIRIWTASKLNLSRSLDVDVSVSVLDTDPPTIDSPSDMTIEEGESACVTWTPSDTYPSTYEVHDNGALVDSGDWDGSPIECQLGTFQSGTHVLVITVYDLGGNSITDEVEVIVTELGGETSPSPGNQDTPLSPEAAAFQWSVVLASWIGGFAVFFIVFEYVTKR